MYQQRKHFIEDRSISISQPYIRPIVRGKAGSRTEFEDKFSSSDIDAYNEGKELISQIENYKELLGFYP